MLSPSPFPDESTSKDFKDSKNSSEAYLKVNPSEFCDIPLSPPSLPFQPHLHQGTSLTTTTGTMTSIPSSKCHTLIDSSALEYPSSLPSTLSSSLLCKEIDKDSAWEPNGSQVVMNGSTFLAVPTSHVSLSSSNLLESQINLPSSQSLIGIGSPIRGFSLSQAPIDNFRGVQIPRRSEGPPFQPLPSASNLCLPLPLSLLPSSPISQSSSPSPSIQSLPSSIYSLYPPEPLSGRKVQIQETPPNNLFEYVPASPDQVVTLPSLSDHPTKVSNISNSPRSARSPTSNPIGFPSPPPNPQHFGERDLLLQETLEGTIYSPTISETSLSSQTLLSLSKSDLPFPNQVEAPAPLISLPLKNIDPDSTRSGESLPEISFQSTSPLSMNQVRSSSPSTLESSTKIVPTIPQRTSAHSPERAYSKIPGKFDSKSESVRSISRRVDDDDDKKDDGMRSWTNSFSNLTVKGPEISPLHSNQSPFSSRPSSTNSLVDSQICCQSTPPRDSPSLPPSFQTFLPPQFHPQFAGLPQVSPPLSDHQNLKAVLMSPLSSLRTAPATESSHSIALAPPNPYLKSNSLLLSSASSVIPSTFDRTHTISSVSQIYTGVPSPVHSSPPPSSAHLPSNDVQHSLPHSDTASPSKALSSQTPPSTSNQPLSHDEQFEPQSNPSQSLPDQQHPMYSSHPPLGSQPVLQPDGQVYYQIPSQYHHPSMYGYPNGYPDQQLGLKGHSQQHQHQQQQHHQHQQHQQQLHQQQLHHQQHHQQQQQQQQHQQQQQLQQQHQQYQQQQFLLQQQQYQQQHQHQLQPHLASSPDRPNQYSQQQQQPPPFASSLHPYPQYHQGSPPSQHLQQQQLQHEQRQQQQYGYEGQKGDVGYSSGYGTTSQVPQNSTQDSFHRGRNSDSRFNSTSLSNEGNSKKSGSSSSSGNMSAMGALLQKRGSVGFDASLEMIRQNAKKSSDPDVQLEFAKYLITLAEAAQNSDPDPKKARKNQEILLAEGLKWIKRLAQQGIGLGKSASPEAQFFLAECYGNGSLGLGRDNEKAFNLYVQASKQSHAGSTYRTAVCYEVGSGTKKDSHRAVLFYRKAGALGDTAAMYKLGMILFNGLLHQPRSPREGVTWLKRAAAQADETCPHALHELGLLYEGTTSRKGSGGSSTGGGDSSGAVIPDQSYSFDLFSKGAQLGYAPSQYKLGLCYEYGILNLPVDPRLSIGWYTKAAEQGDPDSELALSGWYLTGSPGILAQSDHEAYLWGRKSADSGNAKAEYAIAYYSEQGIGIRPDMNEARRWYLRSATQGNKRAISRIKELKAQATAASRNLDARNGEWREKQSGGSDCSLM